MNRRFRLAGVILAVLTSASGWAADTEHGKEHGKEHGGRCHCCPRCQTPCYPAVTKEKVTKYGFDVTCKTICIPRVTFPWEACGACGKHPGKDGCGCPQPARCGRTKTVRVLLKQEYECSACKYSWNPEPAKDDTGVVVPEPNNAASLSRPVAPSAGSGYFASPILPVTIVPESSRR